MKQAWYKFYDADNPQHPITLTSPAPGTHWEVVRTTVEPIVKGRTTADDVYGFCYFVRLTGWPRDTREA